MSSRRVRSPVGRRRWPRACTLIARRRVHYPRLPIRRQDRTRRTIVINVYRVPHHVDRPSPGALDSYPLPMTTIEDVGDTYAMLYRPARLAYAGTDHPPREIIRTDVADHCARRCVDNARICDTLRYFGALFFVDDVVETDWNVRRSRRIDNDIGRHITHAAIRCLLFVSDSPSFARLTFTEFGDVANERMRCVHGTAKANGGTLRRREDGYDGCERRLRRQEGRRDRQQGDWLRRYGRFDVIYRAVVYRNWIYRSADIIRLSPSHSARCNMANDIVIITSDQCRMTPLIPRLYLEI